MNETFSKYRRCNPRTISAGRPSVASVMQDGPRKKDERREEFFRARYKERLTRRSKSLIFIRFPFTCASGSSYGSSVYQCLAPGGRRFPVLQTGQTRLLLHGVYAWPCAVRVRSHSLRTTRPCAVRGRHRTAPTTPAARVSRSTCVSSLGRVPGPSHICHPLSSCSETPHG